MVELPRELGGVLRVLVIAATALGYSVIGYFVLRFLYRLTRPLSAPPVLGADPYTRLLVLNVAFCILMWLAGAVKQATGATVIPILFAVGTLIALYFLVRRDARRHEHLREHGTRVSCVVVGKSKSTRAWPPRLVLTVEDSPGSTRELAVSAREFHTVSVGDPITLVVHPESSRHWKIETGQARAADALLSQG